MWLSDVLDHAKQANYFPGIESWISYLAKLYNEEFHLLARREVKGVADLANQRVNVDLRGAGTAITAGRLFDLLNIAVTPTYDDQEVAWRAPRIRARSGAWPGTAPLPEDKPIVR